MSDLSVSESCPASLLRLAMTDTPECWSRLVEQIAELEELLAETEIEIDAYGNAVTSEIRALLQQRRERLCELDVGD